MDRALGEMLDKSNMKPVLQPADNQGAQHRLTLSSWNLM